MTDENTASTSAPNTTAVEGWNITTLKAYIDVRISALKIEMDLKFTAVSNRFDARDKALDLQFNLDQEHFRSLNNEAARLIKQQEASVSRDMWNTSQDAYRVWQADINNKLPQALSRTEFIAYKEATDKALNLGAGKYQGVIQLVSLVASVGAIVGVAFALMK